MKAVSALPRGPWTLQGSCRPGSSGRGKNLFLYFSRGIKTASKGPSRCPCCAFEEESEEPCCVRGDAIDPSRTLGARVRVTRGLVGALGLVCRCLVRGMRAQVGMRGALSGAQHDQAPQPDLARPARRRCRKVKSGQAGLRKVLCGLRGARGTSVRRTIS